jgi:hypothetical protein
MGLAVLLLDLNCSLYLLAHSPSIAAVTVRRWARKACLPSLHDFRKSEQLEMLVSRHKLLPRLLFQILLPHPPAFRITHGLTEISV